MDACIQRCNENVLIHLRTCTRLSCSSYVVCDANLKVVLDCHHQYLTLFGVFSIIVHQSHPLL